MMQTIGVILSMTNISVVCISRNRESFAIRDLPYHNYTQGWKPFGHEKTRKRVSYLAERRNTAVTEALSLLPETRHILMIDSYYLQQGEQVGKLIAEYVELNAKTHSGGCILGASSWIYDKTRIWPRTRFYEGWTTAEGNGMR